VEHYEAAFIWIQRMCKKYEMKMWWKDWQAFLILFLHVWCKTHHDTHPLQINRDAAIFFGFNLKQFNHLEARVLQMLDFDLWITLNELERFKKRNPHRQLELVCNTTKRAVSCKRALDACHVCGT
jgi:hypothetical protein